MENIKNKNSFIITCVGCIVLILTLCYFGVNSSLKSTYAAWTCDSGYKIANTKYCCPSDKSNYVDGYCVSGDVAKQGYCAKSITGNFSSYLDGWNNFNSDKACSDKLGSGWVHQSSSLSNYNGTIVCKSSTISACGVAAKNASYSSDSTTEYGCYKSNNGYVWVSTSSVIANTYPKYNASSRDECVALNNNSSDGNGNNDSGNQTPSNPSGGNDNQSSSNPNGGNNNQSPSNPSGGTGSSIPDNDNITDVPDNSNNNDVNYNPQTGAIAIFICWIIGLASIVYSVWYFRKVKEN